MVASKQKPPETSLSVKIKKTVKEKRPPYIIKFNKIDARSELTTGYNHYVLSIQGKKDKVGDDRIQGSGWKFDLDLELIHVVDKMNSPNIIVIESVYNRQTSSGSGKATVTDMGGKTGEEYSDPMDEDRAKREKKQKEKDAAAEKAKKRSGMTPEEREEDIKKEAEQKKNPPPKDLYRSSLIINGSGMQAPDSRLYYLHYIVPAKVMGERVRHSPDSVEYIGAIDYNLEFTINDKDFVKGTLTYTDKCGGNQKIPLEGKLTCQSELVVKWQIDGKFPIWGTWTNADVYAAVPKILQDHEKRRAQLAAKAKDPSAKVDTVTYNNGKWIMIMQGPKKLTKADMEITKEHYSYFVLEINNESIFYESGVFNYLGTWFKLIPDERYRFPRDHQNNLDLYSKPLGSYKPAFNEPTLFDLRYNVYTDTILPCKGYFNGVTMHRLKDAPITAVWSSSKGIERPDPANIRSNAGIWYEFKSEKGTYVDTVNEAGEPIKKYVPSKYGGYTFERLTVNKDNTAESVSGRSELYGFDDTLRCYIWKRTRYGKDGKAAAEEYEPEKDEDGNEDENFEYEKFRITYSEYDKSAGTIKFNEKEFYKVTKASLNGTWCSDISAPPLPDTSKENAREALMEYYKNNTEWLKLDSSGRTFIRVLWEKDGEEMKLLTETGKYSTRGGSQIVLDEIVGTCYSAANELLFEDIPDPSGTETLVYRTDDSNADIMVVNGIKMYKAK